MQKAKIVEVVTGAPKQGISMEEAKAAIMGLNQFVKEQPGFIERKTSINSEGFLLDVIYWTDMESATKASESAINTGVLHPILETIEEETMKMEYFEVFNSIGTEATNLEQ